ncbi:MAG TPA: SRPBCC domain-containing protein [Casimicrobiaceae bacterium]
MPKDDSQSLTVRRTIRASPEFLFDAWTQPARLLAWWGPEGVKCIDAAVDLRIGGDYRLGNRLPDGTMLWISGTFEAVDRPRRLVYSWMLEGKRTTAERVTVRFEPGDAGTEVIVLHERIADDELRRGHALGWKGCLDGLTRFSEDSPSVSDVETSR